MKIYADGTMEGTPEELAQYASLTKTKTVDKDVFESMKTPIIAHPWVKPADPFKGKSHTQIGQIYTCPHDTSKIATL